MIHGAIAKRYATALLELGVESNQLDGLVNEVRFMSRVYQEHHELRRTLSDPLLAASAKRAILGDLAARVSLSPTTLHALWLLVDRRRIDALPAIAQRLTELADAKRGILRAEVLTAMPLPDAYFIQLQQQLERITGRKVALDRKLDPSLICGVVARVGDTVFDGSVMTRLRRLEESMLPN